IRAALGSREEVVIQADPYWIAARRVPTPKGSLVLTAVFPTPARILDLTTQISTQYANYALLHQQQVYYRDTHILILALVTLLALFAAVWIGLNLSKRITVPIEALSAATREISQGNLDYRIDVQAEDELGLLIKLFNDMAQRLQF